MKEYVLKREAIFHLLALVAIVASVFVHEVYLKLALVLLGTLGLSLIAYIKDKKRLALTYILLLLGGFLIYYLKFLK